MSPVSRISSDPLTPRLLDALRAQLAPDERLTWAAAPEPSAFDLKKRRRGKWDAVAILGGGYATLGSAVMALSSKRWLWLAIPISLAVISVLGYLVARWVNVRARKSVEGTAYGLTTRRALIVQTYPALDVQWLPIDAIVDVTVVEKDGDFGHLNLLSDPATPGPLFRGIADPERACEQLLRVIRDPQATEQEIVAFDAYITQMRQLMAPRG